VAWRWMVWGRHGGQAEGEAESEEGDAARQNRMKDVAFAHLGMVLGITLLRTTRGELACM